VEEEMILSSWTFACLLFLLARNYEAFYVKTIGSSLLRRGVILNMKWVFSKGSGSLADVGGIGSQGELYFIPSKRPTLRAPAEAIGKEVSIPIFPRNSVLGPMGEEYLGVYEMRYRQLINEVGEGGIFGHVYYSQENSKLALVGTLAKIKRIERLEDGGMYVFSEGVGRFYLRDIKAEKPYLRARVQIFQDYCENEKVMTGLEASLLNEVRYSVKLMKLLYPQNNYTINEAVIRNRPLVYTRDVRGVVLPRLDSETVRRSKFSFANMDMLKTDPVTKLLFLQEPLLEKRYATMLKVGRFLCGVLLLLTVPITCWIMAQAVLSAGNVMLPLFFLYYHTAHAYIYRCWKRVPRSWRGSCGAEA
jgi:hypothetical protein